jgi:hypothetical protein
MFDTVLSEDSCDIAATAKEAFEAMTREFNKSYAICPDFPSFQPKVKTAPAAKSSRGRIIA